MRRLSLIALTLILVISSNAFAQDNEAQPKDSISEEITTTYYLIRHAEKDRSNPTNKDPKLTKDGLLRAFAWATKEFKEVSFDAVYSTNYKRTKLTAKQVAQVQNLDIKLYDPRKLYTSSFQEETLGKTVLVVGHSNTTPQFVNAIIGESTYEDMADDDNSSLYIVTVKGEEKDVLVKTVN